MKICEPVYLKPDKGQSVVELSKEIEQYLEAQANEKKVFVILPDGKTIEVVGKSFIEIRDSIGTQCAYGRF